MLVRRRGAVVRAGTLALVLMSMASSATSVFAVKPSAKPPVVKVAAVAGVHSVTMNYQVNVPASDVIAQVCTFDLGFITLVDPICDPTPNNGSGAKLTKYSLTQEVRRVEDFGFTVDLTLASGAHVSAGTRFTVLPGPATRFAVTGLVEQRVECVAGPDCVTFPNAQYPRQIVKVAAVDTYGNIATGYTGTVTFRDPYQGGSRLGVPDLTLTNGIGYVPVAFPLLGFLHPDFEALCPPATPFTHVALMVEDTVDPSLKGCQSVQGGTLSIIFPDGFLDATSDTCATGCFNDPTGSIVIDTNFIAPFIQGPVSGDSIVIAGGTIGGLYYTQTVSTTTWVFSGEGVILNPACTACSSSMIYLADPTFTVGNTITLDADGVATLANISPFDEVVNTQVSTVTTGALEPSCYTDPARQLAAVFCL